MDSNPIITCHGDQILFKTLRPVLTQNLPREPVEWRRSYGRPPRTICVEADFVPFNVDILPKEGDRRLIGQPFFHLYWTDCDLETYRSSTKDDIASWISVLKNYGISDWMIVIVVHEENRVKTKLLPRTSVLDKVKGDFCPKSSDRCLVLSEPFKNETKSGESWSILLSKLRQHMLQSFNKNLSKFEDHMRSQREQRTQPGWNFCSYFMLQEELAFMFEMLGLYEDAMVQYDELDAVFTQFVLNHAAGATADWLTALSQPCQCWDGLNLSKPVPQEKRFLIQLNKANLLDLRNYLFSRQCALLLLLHRPWEMAQRSLPFMHNCVQELDILEVTMPKGSMACWVFLSCLEVLQTCERFSDTSQVEAYSLYTASLWDYARRKLEELGLLCGLMPSEETSSEQLQLVVDLIAGLGHSYQAGASDTLAPRDKLRESLSSKAAFQKHYLELSELAMGTFKHIGRIRSARMIGLDLAKFHINLGEPAKTESFLMDALKMYKTEGWTQLADRTRLEIAHCQEMLENTDKYVKSCIHLASSSTLDVNIRKEYCEKLMKIAKGEQDTPLQVRSSPVFTAATPSMPQKSFVLGTEATVTLVITSHLPIPVDCDLISVSLIYHVEPINYSPREDEKSPRPRIHRRHASSSSTHSMDHELTSPVLSEVDSITNSMPAVLDVQHQYEIKADKTLVSAGLTVLNAQKVLSRVDSGGLAGMKEKALSLDDYSLSVKARNLTLQPGSNTVTLKTKADQIGNYQLSQLCTKIAGLEFIKPRVANSCSFNVICDEPRVSLKPTTGVLLAGVKQEVTITVNTGSHPLQEGSTLTLSSQSLKITVPGEAEPVIILPATEPYEVVERKAVVVAEVEEYKAEKQWEHLITVASNWNQGELFQSLVFVPPFQLSHRLHTAGTRKFAQVSVETSSDLEFALKNASLQIKNSADFELLSLNKHGKELLINQDQKATFLWQLKCNLQNNSSCPPLRCYFSLSYTHGKDAEERNWNFAFDVQNYKTLFTLKSELEPASGETEYKSGSTCKLKVHVQQLEDSVHHNQLQYELMVDKNCWAIFGKGQGTLSLADKRGEVTLNIVPLLIGQLPLPGLRLTKPLVEESSQSTSSCKCAPFNPGEVYNYTQAVQVKVVPAS